MFVRRAVVTVLAVTFGGLGVAACDRPLTTPPCAVVGGVELCAGDQPDTPPTSLPPLPAPPA